ncbi:MAG: phosphoribosylformylglycinamidine synthase I [Phycisphaerae bacterium]
MIPELFKNNAGCHAYTARLQSRRVSMPNTNPLHPEIVVVLTFRRFDVSTFFPPRYNPDMANIRVTILRAPGINCDEETAHAWERAGARTRRIHINRLIENPDLLLDDQILTLPGGFSYGDDIAAGRILANQLRRHLADAIQHLLDRGGLILGICNGCQVLVRMGLLPGPDFPKAVSINQNDSGRYEDRWVHVRAEVSHCPFLCEGEFYHLPVAHGEGKFVVEDSSEHAVALTKLHRIALRYVDRSGVPVAYPQNPNGSIENIAGLVDLTGRVLGLMPHPERCLVATHSPLQIRPINPENSLESPPDGLRLFRNAVRYLA